MALPFYRHSGKVPAAAMAALPIASLVFAIIAGSVFGYMEFLAHLLPATKLMILAIGAALFGLGAVLGVMPAYIAVRLKARSTPVLLFITFLESCVAMYCAWVFWIIAYLNYFHAPVSARIANPLVLWHFVSIIDNHGTWGIGFGTRPTGMVLAGLWIAEIVIVFATALAVARKLSLEKVFCEHCHKWGVKRSLMQISSIDSDKLRTTIPTGNFDLLRTAERSATGEDCWNDITLEGCDTCDNLQTLTITRSIRVRNGRKTEIKRKKVLHRLLISPEQTVDLAQIAAAVTSTSPSEPA